MSKFQKIYRIVENSNCNDFNDELPYTIITYELDEKRNKMRVCGYSEWVDAIDFYYYRNIAEQDLVRLCSKQLEQENEQLKKELEENDTYRQRYNLAGAEETIEVLKEQLAEKDKEIEKLKLELEENENIIDFHMKNNIYNVALKDYSVLAPYPKNMAQIISHEICEKIREFIKAYRTQDCNNVYTINVDDELLIDDNLLKKLNQIEQGDE